MVQLARSPCNGNHFSCTIYLPTRASEQGNVIGLVSVYIYICHQKNCN